MCVQGWKLIISLGSLYPPHWYLFGHVQSQQRNWSISVCLLNSKHCWGQSAFVLKLWNMQCRHICQTEGTAYVWNCKTATNFHFCFQCYHKVSFLIWESHFVDLANHISIWIVPLKGQGLTQVPSALLDRPKHMLTIKPVLKTFVESVWIVQEATSLTDWQSSPAAWTVLI